MSASPPDELARYFGTEPAGRELEESYNVAPTDDVYAVRARDGHRELSPLRWGLIPFFAKDAKIGSRMINARSETAAIKPAFRRAFKKRRCLLPADGFYEWALTGQNGIEAVLDAKGKPRKQPYFIYRPDEEPLVFAGLWERWYPKDDEGNDQPDVEPFDTCTILTCGPNETMAAIHDRMPVMIPPNAWDEWLDPESDPEALGRLLVPAPDSLLTMHTITTAVNNVRNQGPQLIEPGSIS